MLQTLKYRLTGVVALHQHNGQLADPLAQWSRELKKVSNKKNKTDADHEEMARLEWYGGLYTDEGRVVIPGRAMDATLINAAKKTRKGIIAKASLICEGNFLVEHDGPEDIDELWEDERFRYRILMRVKNAGVMRTFPHFFPWATTIVVTFNDEALNPADIDTFVRTGGDAVGVLEGRPRFGRYTAQRL